MGWKEGACVCVCMCVCVCVCGVIWHGICPFIWCIKIAAFFMLLLLIKTVVGTSLGTMCWFSHLLLVLESILCIVLSQRNLVILFSLYLNDQLCMCDLSLLYPVLEHVCLGKKQVFFFFFFLREQWKLIILLYNAVVLSTWLRHYSLASVISLCLKLFNSDNNSSEEYNYSTRILCIRTWSVSYFSCLFGGDVAAYWWLSIPP